MVRHGILVPTLPGSNPGTLVSGRFFCSLCFSSPAGTMMLHANCNVHLLSNTPLAESWLKIRHKDRRGLLEHLSHDAQACKSTYAFWHERSRKRRCHFIQNPPLILYVFEWQVCRASVIRADGKMVQIHPCHYPARDLFLWPAGLIERLVGGGWNAGWRFLLFCSNIKEWLRFESATVRFADIQSLASGNAGSRMTDISSNQTEFTKPW